MQDDSRTLTLRIPASVVEKLDRLVASLRAKDILAAQVSRNALIVSLVSNGCDEFLAAPTGDDAS